MQQFDNCQSFGEDTLTQLAFTLQANRKIYALLLGSGISRTSGIMTGWEITCDLIKRYAQITEIERDWSNFITGEDWAKWFRDTFDKEPDYSDILEKLGKFPQERQSIIEKYIEPTREDIQKNIKIPTKAHQSIARLVAGGFIKVIITTNFDRLLEQALSEVGITPTVIASEHDLSAQKPLDHANCYILKLHGDYKDGYIKNTNEELSKYSLEYQTLLKRIFNDYGLIVCGWSAEWDTALKDAIRSATVRRYTLYWASYNEPGDEAHQLIHERNGEVIPIKKLNGADGFFTALADKVEQIEKLSLRRPRTEALILATLKDYLAEPEKNRIKIDELFQEELTRLIDFPEFHQPEWISKSWADKFSICETQTQILAKMVALLGKYGKGEKKEVELVCALIQKIVDHLRNEVSGGILYGFDQTGLIYPAYILFMVYGIALTSTERWAELHQLFWHPLMNVRSNLEGEEYIQLPLWYYFGTYSLEIFDSSVLCDVSLIEFNQLIFIKDLLINVLYCDSNILFFIDLFCILGLITSIERKSLEHINHVIKKYSEIKGNKSHSLLFGFQDSPDNLTILVLPYLITSKSLKKIKDICFNSMYIKSFKDAGFSLMENKEIMIFLFDRIEEKINR